MHLSRIIDRLGALYRALRSGGPRRVAMTVRLWLLSADDRRFEDRYQLDTRTHVELDALGVEPDRLATAFSYAPAPGRIVHHLFDSIDCDPDRTTFVDFGSGKGRVLLLAILRGFRQVVGIEFSPKLVELAEQNVDCFGSQHQHSQSVRIVLGDAGEFVIPPGDCILHFNNPFNQDVMQRVLENVRRAGNEEPRRIWLAYQQLRPDLEESSSTNLELLGSTPFLRELPLKPLTGIQRWLFGCHAVKLFEVTDAARPEPTAIDARDIRSMAAESLLSTARIDSRPRSQSPVAELT